MADQAEAVSDIPAPTHHRRRSQELNALIGLIGIAAIFEILGWLLEGQSFLFNTQRLSIMILQVSVIGVIAVGVTQVIITGGIDLSSGSVVGASAMIAMSFAQVSTYPRAMYPELTDLPVIIPVAIGLGCGLAAGLINGALIAYTKIPAFIATLGMMVTARGIAKWYSHGMPISFPTEGYASIGAGMTPVFIFLGVALVFHIALKYTRYGKHTYAIGSNQDAARVSGINVERHLILVYAIAGVLAALAGIVVSARGLTAQAGMGVMYELDAIAMAVIGGVSLSGGRGSIPGTIIGAIIFGVIISGLHVPQARRLLSGNDQGRDHRRCCGGGCLSPAPAHAGAMMATGFLPAGAWDQVMEDGLAGEERNVILKTEGLTKHYGGVHALQDADFELFDGEHIAIVGDNGAGKSTFVRQITGVERPTSGQIFFDGKPVEFHGPIDAREVGIEAVFQNLALADDLDVPSNIFLGREEIYFDLGPFSFLNERKMLQKSIEALERTGIKIPDVKNKIRNMSGGQRQCVAISRSASFASKLIIMDEPTAALGVQETTQVENIIRNLKSRAHPFRSWSATISGRSSISLTELAWYSGVGASSAWSTAKRPTVTRSSR